MGAADTEPDVYLSWRHWYAKAEEIAGRSLTSPESAHDAWLTGSTAAEYVRSLEPAPRPPLVHRGVILALLAAVLVLIVIKLAVHTALALAGLPQIPLVDGSVFLAALLAFIAFAAWVDATA